jgi:hypothetical protein
MAAFLTHERVRSTFWEGLPSVTEENGFENRRAFQWHDSQQGIYEVDCRINGMRRPLVALQRDDRTGTRRSRFSNLRNGVWPQTSLGIFEDQKQINGKVLAWFTDVRETSSPACTEIGDRIGGI